MARLSFVLIAVALIVGMASRVQASIFVPDGLSPGDSYHFAFVTDSSYTVDYDPISTFNNRVTDQAGLSGAITEDWNINWNLIGSTDSVDARDNAIVSGPVFLLDGTKIADDYNDMWDGNLDVGIYLDQFGNATNILTVAWTGSSGDGTAVSGFNLDDDQKVVGLVHAHNYEAIGIWLGQALRTRLTDTAHFYALSEPLTVPDGNLEPNPIPEPASIITWTLLGVVGCIATWWRRRRRAG